MNAIEKMIFDQNEQDLLCFDVSDEALEGAVAIESAANFTLGDCTALSECPAW